MRLIEFRAWDKINKRMGMVIGIQFSPYEIQCDFGDLGVEWEGLDRKDGILLQFTGLLDKNGKMIFEGDLLRSNYQYSPNYEVFYWGAGFEGRCKPVPGISTGSIGFSSFKDMEIIGNIYENSELLGEK